MDYEVFISWALDPARTLEERYTTELLVEWGVHLWEAKNKIHRPINHEAMHARHRERELNPAYEPAYTETQAALAAYILPELKEWRYSCGRALRSFTPLRFLPALESLDIHMHCEVEDFSLLAELPALRKLHLGAPGHVFGQLLCRDLTPLTRCTALRHLSLAFDAKWPDLTGLGALTELEELALSGNLLALPRDLVFPKVRTGTFHCLPLAARCLGDLPHLPGCRFFTLQGVERLEGIELMPELLNLKLLGPFESFAPLTTLPKLTCLTVEPTGLLDLPRMPRAVSPLVQLPKLHCLTMGPAHMADMPRDYAPLAEAPALRELIVRNCHPVEMEVSAIQASLPPCDDLYLWPEPLRLAPLRFIVTPHGPSLPRRDEHRRPEETEPIDLGLRESESRWVAAYAGREIAALLENPDWGNVKAFGLGRWLQIYITSFDLMTQVPLLIDSIRRVMARLRDYDRTELMITLKTPEPELTPAQQELADDFQEQRDRWETEQRARDRAEYLDKLHQLELKQQQNLPVDPDEFSPSEPPPYPQAPVEKDDEEDGEEDDEEDDDPTGEGGVGVQEKLLLPANWFDDDHPLSYEYLISGVLTLEEVWFRPHSRDLAVQLMQREPDLDLPDEEKKAE